MGLGSRSTMGERATGVAADALVLVHNGRVGGCATMTVMRIVIVSV